MALVQAFFTTAKENSNAVVISFLTLSYHIFENEFPCSCEPQTIYCIAYMVMPVCMVVALMLSTDAQLQRVWRYTLTNASCHFGFVFFRSTVKAICVGLVWPAAVLLSADWFVCCYNQNSQYVAELQCQGKAEITPGGEAVVSIAEMKINSRVSVCFTLIRCWSHCSVH